MKTKEGDRVERVHRVLHCSQCHTTWNRDANASRNILFLAQMELGGLVRPDPFVRGRPF